MRVAALFDIHGNLPALEAVLRDVRNKAADLVVVGGDVLPGPMPHESLGLLLTLDVPARFIMGNGDREVVRERLGTGTSGVPESFRDVIRHSAHAISADDERLIAAWPATLRLEIDGIGGVLFCHATPRNDTDVFTRVTPGDRLLPVFEGSGAKVVICGHTHMQFDRAIGDIRVVNAGSVGMPFGDPGAYWLLLGPGVEMQHTSYDLTAAADRIRASTYPRAEEFAERSVLHPPSELEALERFRPSELR